MAIQKVPGNMIGIDSQVNSDIMYFNGTDWVRLEKGEADQILTVNEAGDAPEWGEPACTFQGVARGYVCGGWLGKIPDTTGTPIYGKQIQKFSLVTDGDSTDIGDLIATSRNQAGNSSQTHGYVVGGQFEGVTAYIRIERFPFASDADAVDWADMSGDHRIQPSAASSAEYGFTLGGQNIPGAAVDTIDKYPFASQTNATDWADATTVKAGGAGCSSITHGYSMGGVEGSPGSSTVNVIESYPFASQVGSTDIGDLLLARASVAGVSSCDDGYAVGGSTPNTNPANSAPIWDRTNIDKHSFSSGGNSTDHGDLPVESGAGAHSGAGVSGTTHGYHVGGVKTVNGSMHQFAREQIEKFAYASNVTASDVGDLVQVGTNVTPNFGMDGCSGHQV